MHVRSVKKYEEHIHACSRATREKKKYDAIDL